VSDFRNPSVVYFSADISYREAFPQLPDADQCYAIELLSRICCATDETLHVDSLPSRRLGNMACLCCQIGKTGKAAPNSTGAATKREAQKIFAKLIRLPCFVGSKRPRVIAMMALRRLVFHTNDAEFFDLETSGPGQWCIQSLQSSLRELRIAGGWVELLFWKEAILTVKQENPRDISQGHCHEWH
jgi:serine/threonine-protein kinase ATR